MEQNNTPVETKKVNKKLVWLAIILAISALAISTYFIYSKRITQLSEKKVQVAPALLTIKTKVFQTQSEKGLQLYLANKTEPVEISAFQIKLNLPDNFNQDELKIKTNVALEDQGWQFPIVRAEKEDGQTVIKFSGFRLGNSPYAIKGNLLLATVYNLGQASLTLELDQKDTLIYGVDAVTAIPFDSAAE